MSCRMDGDRDGNGDRGRGRSGVTGLQTDDGERQRHNSSQTVVELIADHGIRPTEWEAWL